MRIILVLFLACVAASAYAGLSQSPSHVYHPSWKMVADVADHHKHCFNVALKHTDSARKQLEDLFWKVSDPKHSMYAQYLSHKQVTDLMTVPQEDVKIVTDWLRAGGATDIKLAGNNDFLDVCMTVSQIEAHFGVQMKHFEHIHTQEKRPRADRVVSVPSHISDRVSYFGGIDTPMHSYRRPHRMAEAEVAAPARVNAAPPVSVTQGNEEVTVNFVVYCRNGQINTDPAIPCISHPPAVSTFEISVTQEGRSPNTFALYPADDVMCIPSASCSATLPVRNYLGTTVSVSVVFADGNHTDIAPNSIPVFAQDFVTPQFLKKLYGIPDGLVCKSPQSSQSVAEFLNETYNPNDLKEWFSRMGLRDESSKVTVIGPNDNIGTGEATLDIQTIMGVAGNTSQVVFWSTPGLNERPGQEPFLIWLQQIASTPVVPFVHSISFGDTEKFLKQSYMSAVHVEFQKAGVRGISLLYSSGDYGVASSYNDTLSNRCMQDNPEWPASSPYVTAVGATQLSTYTNRFCTQTFRGGPISCSTVREKMCDAASGGVITSGGGFSDVHARPSYQDGAVAKYLAQQGAYPPQANWFNTGGRAYPDVSAYGTNFLLVMEGQITSLSGTSASAPTFAGVVTLLNDIRYINGQGPMGFLNPWLYSMYELHPDAFNDVTYGVNNCTVRAEGCCPDGFHAVAGWDAVSGLGTPNFIVLGSVVANGASNPYPYFNPSVAGSGGSCSCTPHEDTTSRHLAIASIAVAIFAIIITSGLAYKATRSSSSGGATGSGGESLLGNGY